MEIIKKKSRKKVHQDEGNFVKKFRQNWKIGHKYFGEMLKIVGNSLECKFPDASEEMEMQFPIKLKFQKKK